MTNTRFAVFSTPMLFVVLVAASTTASSSKGGDYWVFVTGYVLVALFAPARRLWIGVVCVLAVAGVRSMVALKITGWPFEVLSSFFVASLFLLVQMAGWTTAWRKR